MSAHPAENDAPPCAVASEGNPRYCHLQGVRYNARPCASVCELADDTAENDAPRWRLNPTCGHSRCKGYTSCRVARVIPPGEGATR